MPIYFGATECKKLNIAPMGVCFPALLWYFCHNHCCCNCPTANIAQTWNILALADLPVDPPPPILMLCSISRSFHSPCKVHKHKMDPSYVLVFCFSCSLSVQKLMVLAYEMLHEATTSSDACAVQLFYSVSNMFELFCCVVPTFHKASLTTIPQLAG